MNRMKLSGVMAAVTGALVFSFGVNAMADSTDDLVQTLMAKGVLTEEEGAQLLKGRDSEKQTANKSKAGTLTGTFKDGFGFESGDKTTAIGINGRIQEDYRNYGRTDAQNTDALSLRRAYLTVKGKVYSDYDFNITADFAQGQTASNAAGAASTVTNQLDEAYFGINWWDQARFRFGQFKMPFGMEQYTSDIFTDFQERFLGDVLTPGKERGGMVYGVPTKGVYYGLAGSTGRGKNVDNNDPRVEGLDTIGRATVNFAEIFGQTDAVYHLGGDFSYGKISATEPFGSATTVGFAAPAATTEGKGLKFFSPGVFTAATGDHIDRTRYGVEAAVAYGPFKVQSEYLGQNYNGTTALRLGYDKDITSWYVAASWLVTGEKFADSYKDGVFGRIKPKNEFVHPNAGYGTGAVELSLRYSDFDGSDFAFNPVAAQNVGTGNLASGAATGARAWTAGVNWILNPNTRFVLNLVDTRFTDGTFTSNGVRASGEDAVTARAQFDF